MDMFIKEEEEEEENDYLQPEQDAAVALGYPPQPKKTRRRCAACYKEAAPSGLAVARRVKKVREILIILKIFFGFQHMFLYFYSIENSLEVGSKNNQKHYLSP